MEGDNHQPQPTTTRIPFTARLCIFLFLCFTLAFTLYAHIKGIKYSFIGLLVAFCVCVLILKNRNREAREAIAANTNDDDDDRTVGGAMYPYHPGYDGDGRTFIGSDAQLNLLLQRFQLDEVNCDVIGGRRPPSYSEQGKFIYCRILPMKIKYRIMATYGMEIRQFSQNSLLSLSLS